jgi:hypothetical protein
VASRTGPARGVSPLIGFVLLFGLLVTTLAVVQLTAVPIWNEADELQHSGRVMKGVEELATVVRDVAVTGLRDSVTVELGVQYTTRPFLLNPPNPTGTLTTTPRREANIANAVAIDPEVRDHLDGGGFRYDTVGVVYEPDYNEYQRAPDVVYHGGHVLNRFSSGSALLAQTPVVDGRRIALTALDGSFSRSGADSMVVDAVPLSAPARPVAVRAPPGENLTITLPTTLSADQWSDVLDGESVEEGGFVDDLDVGDGEATITLLGERDGQRVTYELALAKVGVERGYDRESVRYLAPPPGHSSQLVVEAGQRTDIAVEARDRFNAPVSGVNVSFALDGEGVLTRTSDETTTDGRAGSTFVAPDEVGNATVTASYGFLERERVEFDVDVVSSAAAAGQTVLQPNRPGSVALLDAAIDEQGCRKDVCDVTLTFDNRASEDKTIEEMRLTFYGETFFSSQPKPRTVETMTVDGVQMTNSGPYRTVSVTLPPGASAVEATFEGSSQSTELIEPGDIFVISAVYGDGEEAVYFAGPT